MSTAARLRSLERDLAVHDDEELARLSPLERYVRTLTPAQRAALGKRILRRAAQLAHEPPEDPDVLEARLRWLKQQTTTRIPGYPYADRERWSQE